MADIRRFINNGDYYYFGNAPVHVSGVSLDKSEISLSTVGQTEQLTATIIPANPVETVSLNWSSSDTSVATVAPYVPRLPSEYQEVEYIQSSGTQYIDTGYYANDKTTVQAKFIYTTYGGGSILGGGGSGETDQFRFFRATNTTYLDYGSGSGYNRIQGTYVTSQTDIYETEFGNRYVKDIPTNTVKFSGSTVSFSAKSYTFKILGGSGDFAKMYYVKIYDNGNLIRDYIPCYRKSDSVIGMYDLVNDMFYINAGTGNFTKGDNISPDAVVTCVTPGECTITVTTTPGSYTATCSVKTYGIS